MLGDPRPIHTLPRDLFHVTNDSQRYMEMQVDVRRHHTAPEMTSELEYMIIRRTRQLRNESREPDTKVRGLIGTEPDPRRAMRDPGVRRVGARAGPAARPGPARQPRLARRAHRP